MPFIPSHVLAVVGAIPVFLTETVSLRSLHLGTGFSCPVAVRLEAFMSRTEKPGSLLALAISLMKRKREESMVDGNFLNLELAKAKAW